jgi:hypothetical protein
VLQQRLGLQAGVDLQQLLQLGPDVGEGVGLGAPAVLHADLARQPVEAAVLARRLVVHVGPGRGPTAADPPKVEAEEAAHLLISDHPKLLGAKDFGLAYQPAPVAAALTSRREI